MAPQSDTSIFFIPVKRLASHYDIDDDPFFRTVTYLKTELIDFKESEFYAIVFIVYCFIKS